MAGVDFKLTLTDRMSGPAKVAAASINALGSSLGRIQAITAGLGVAGGSAGFSKLATGIEAFGAAVESTYRKVGDAVGGPIGEVIKATGAVTAIATGAISVFVRLSATILEAADAEQTFARQTRAAFEALGGSAEAGEKTYETVELLSKRLPIARDELVSWTKALQEAGITDTGVLRKGLIGLAGSEAITGSAAGAEQLLTTIRKVQEAVQTGQGLKIADRQLAQLAKTGVNVDDVAKELGVSTLQLEQSLKKGTEDAGAFGNALLTAIEKKGQKPLQMMWLSLKKLEEKAEEFGREFIKNIDLGPALDAVTDFVNLMDQATDTGSSLADGVKSGADGVIKAFGGIVNEVTVAGLKMATFALDAETGLIKVENRLNNIVNYLKSIPGRLGALAHGDFDALKMPDANTADAPDVRAAKRLKITQLAKDFAVQRTSGALKGADLQLAADKLVDLLHARVKEGVITPKEDIAIQAAALGSAAVKGFKDGVDKGKGVSEDAGAGMGHAAIKGARGPKGVDAHSPSRKAFAVGKDVAAGLSLGMSTGVDRAAAYMGDQASRASLYAAAAGGHPGGVNASPSSRHPGGVSVSEINIVAPHGVTDAAQLSAYGLSIALERQQLMSGA